MLFLILTLILLFLPLTATFNDLLTQVAINLRGYRFIREVIVPFQVRVVAVVLTGLGYEVSVTNEYVVLGATEPFIAEIVWNCIGWQSILFFILTAVVGLQGDKYTLISKIKALVIGLLGTFLVNIARIVLIVLAAYYLGHRVALFLHDYGTLLIFIGWLFLFWWFVFRFVLEEVSPVEPL